MYCISASETRPILKEKKFDRSLDGWPQLVQPGILVFY